MSAGRSHGNVVRTRGRMPRRVAAEIVLGVPPEVVFDFLADPTTASVIDPSIIRYEPAGGTMGLGVHNSITMRMFGMRLRATSETVDWDPPRRMGFRSIEPRRPVMIDALHEFDTDEASGGTRYRWTITVTRTSTLGGIAAPVVSWFFGRNARLQQSRLESALR